MSERVGVAVIGLNGAVATTAAAGIAMIRAGSNDLSGLPLAGRDVAGLAAYRDLYFGGWDLSHDDLATAAVRHGVIGEKELANGASSLSDMRPWPAVGSTDFCANIDGANKIAAAGHRAAIERIQADLTRFKEEQGLDRVVMVNLASTERKADLAADALSSVEGFERGLDANDGAISPAMLYAYAAIDAGVPYANFTPSVAADVAPLAELAKLRNVPVAARTARPARR